MYRVQLLFGIDNIKDKKFFGAITVHKVREENELAIEERRQMGYVRSQVIKQKDLPDEFLPDLTTRFYGLPLDEIFKRTVKKFRGMPVNTEADMIIVLRDRSRTYNRFYIYRKDILPYIGNFPVLFSSVIDFIRSYK